MSPPRLQAPIVLVHGVVGYGRLNVGGSTFLSYWTNIPEAIAAAGNRVLVPRLPPTASPCPSRGGRISSGAQQARLPRSATRGRRPPPRGA